MQQQKAGLSAVRKKVSGELSGADCLEKIIKRLRRESGYPLVRFKGCLPDGRVLVEFFDRSRRPRGWIPETDFCLDSPRHALECMAYLAEKTWVTKRHLEVFALLAAHHFKRQPSVGQGGSA